MDVKTLKKAEKEKQQAKQMERVNRLVSEYGFSELSKEDEEAVKKYADPAYGEYKSSSKKSVERNARDYQIYQAIHMEDEESLQYGKNKAFVDYVEGKFLQTYTRRNDQSADTLDFGIEATQEMHPISIQTSLLNIASCHLIDGQFSQQDMKLLADHLYAGKGEEETAQEDNKTLRIEGADMLCEIYIRQLTALDKKYGKKIANMDLKEYLKRVPGLWQDFICIDDMERFFEQYHMLCERTMTKQEIEGIEAFAAKCHFYQTALMNLRTNEIHNMQVIRSGEGNLITEPTQEQKTHFEMTRDDIFTSKRKVKKDFFKKTKMQMDRANSVFITAQSKYATLEKELKTFETAYTAIVKEAGDYVAVIEGVKELREKTLIFRLVQQQRGEGAPKVDGEDKAIAIAQKVEAIFPHEADMKEMGTEIRRVLDQFPYETAVKFLIEKEDRVVRNKNRIQDEKMAAIAPTDYIAIVRRAEELKEPIDEKAEQYYNQYVVAKELHELVHIGEEQSFVTMEKNIAFVNRAPQYTAKELLDGAYERYIMEARNIDTYFRQLTYYRAKLDKTLRNPKASAAEKELASTHRVRVNAILDTIPGNREEVFYMNKEELDQRMKMLVKGVAYTPVGTSYSAEAYAKLQEIKDAHKVVKYSFTDALKVQLPTNILVQLQGYFITRKGDEEVDSKKEAAKKKELKKLSEQLFTAMDQMRVLRFVKENYPDAYYTDVPYDQYLKAEALITMLGHLEKGLISLTQKKLRTLVDVDLEQREIEEALKKENEKLTQLKEKSTLAVISDRCRYRNATKTDNPFIKTSHAGKLIASYCPKSYLELAAKGPKFYALHGEEKLAKMELFANETDRLVDQLVKDFKKLTGDAQKAQDITDLEIYQKAEQLDLLDEVHAFLQMYPFEGKEKSFEWDPTEREVDAERAHALQEKGKDIYTKLMAIEGSLSYLKMRAEVQLLENLAKQRGIDGQLKTAGNAFVFCCGSLERPRTMVIEKLSNVKTAAVQARGFLQYEAYRAEGFAL